MRPISPVDWTREVLGFVADDPQKAIMKAVAKPESRVIVESCNGSGKTTVAAVLVLWFLATHRRGTVVTLSGGERQVNSQLWKEIRTWMKRLPINPGWDIPENTAKLSTGQPDRFAIGFSTDTEDRVEGWHSSNLFVVVDEAKAIKENIWNGIDSTLSQAGARMLIATVPDTPVSMTHRKAQQPEYQHLRIVPEQCRDKIQGANVLYTGRVSDGWIAEMKATYGETSAIYRRRVYAEAVTVSESAYFSESIVRQMFANAGKMPAGPRGLAVDWGRKIDWTVVTEWTGTNARIILRTREDYMQVIGRIVNWHRERRYNWIIVDAGEGRGQIDRMNELGLPLRPREGFAFGASIDGAPAKLTIMSLLHTAMEAGQVGVEMTTGAMDEFMMFQALPTSEGRLKLEAAPGFHDDIVCSVAMGYWVARQKASVVGGEVIQHGDTPLRDSEFKPWEQTGADVWGTDNDAGDR